MHGLLVRELDAGTRTRTSGRQSNADQSPRALTSQIGPARRRSAFGFARQGRVSGALEAFDARTIGFGTTQISPLSGQTPDAGRQPPASFSACRRIAETRHSNETRPSRFDGG